MQFLRPLAGDLDLEMLAGRAIDAIELDPGGDAEGEHPADAGGNPRRRLRIGDDVELVRPRKGEAYRACGPVMLESAEGDRPMSIVWQLGTPLPARLFREFSVLRGV